MVQKILKIKKKKNNFVLINIIKNFINNIFMVFRLI